MRLRDHPAMCYHGIPNWPPVWTRSRQESIKTLRGEVGVLTYVYANARASTKCFLVIDHEQKTYVGCLIFSDRAFCAQIASLLRSHIGLPIGEIGNLDVAYTL